MWNLPKRFIARQSAAEPFDCPWLIRGDAVIRLVAFDLDGTILNHNNTPSDASMAAICDLLDRGVAVASMSGRNFERNQIPFVSNPSVADALYAGCYNGAMVFAPKINGTRQLMHEQRLPDDIFSSLIQYADDRLMNFVYCRCDMNSEGPCEVYITDRMTKMSREVATMTNMVYEVDADLAQRIRTKELASPPKIMLLPEPGHADETVDELKNIFGDQIYMAWAVAGRIEIMHPDVNKGAALTAIANHIGGSLDEVMAVGDGNNDLPMLRAAGTGVLMHNADAATHRAVAGENILQTDHIENDGFAKAVRRYVLDR
ncbi:MAG: HAD family phosphatase [Gemmatimonadetes bacterium]|nr:HAD family phosphatase [Gemmatimonadota bacterium]MYF16071.1 HAD family phosphatase [Gemmatimonadota bacterium]